MFMRVISLFTLFNKPKVQNYVKIHTVTYCLYCYIKYSKYINIIFKFKYKYTFIKLI